jgi:hypothetical protein
MVKRPNASIKPNLQSMAQAALQLSQAEKQELITILQGMLEAESLDDELPAVLNQTLKDRYPYHGPKGGRGYYEGIL